MKKLKHLILILCILLMACGTTSEVIRGKKADLDYKAVRIGKQQAVVTELKLECDEKHIQEACEKLPIEVQKLKELLKK